MQAHSYHIKDDSLEEKLKAYREAFCAWRNIEASTEVYREPEWQERLGTREDFAHAQKVIQTTLELAVNSFSLEEIQSLQHLINQEELTYLNDNSPSRASTVEARRKELEQARSKDSSGKNRERQR